MARDDFRTPSSHVTASLSSIGIPKSVGSGLTLGALGFLGTAPAPDENDVCWQHCEENARGFENNRLYHLGAA